MNGTNRSVEWPHVDAAAASDHSTWEERNDRHPKASLHHAHNRFSAGRLKSDARYQPLFVEGVQHVLPACRTSLIENEGLTGQVLQPQTASRAKAVAWSRNQAPARDEQLVVLQVWRWLVRRGQPKGDFRIGQQRVLDLPLVHRAD